MVCPSQPAPGQRWLLVFDNAEDPELLRNIWPHNSQGSVLITSRNSSLAFDPAAGGTNLSPFNEEDGSQAFLRLMDLDPHTSTNKKDAAKISKVFGGLPLALNQIAGFIKQRRIRLSDFLSLYEKNADKIDSSKTGVSDYEHTLSTVWRLSLDNLSGNSRCLQEILAFLDPDRIDERLLIEGSQIVENLDPDLSFMMEEFDLLDAETALLDTALLHKSTESSQLSVHRLVQAAVIRRLPDEHRAKYLDTAIRIVCWGFPDTFSEDVGHQHQSWQNCEICLPHVDFLVKQKSKYQICPPDPDVYAQLLLRCCWYLYERESYDIARVWIKEALANFNNEMTLTFASSMELLGLVEMDTNNQIQALHSFTRTLDIRSKLVAPDDGLIAASFTTLGIVHTELDNLDLAYTYHQRAIDIRLESKSDRIGNSYSNLSSLLLRMGKPDEAEDMLKKCPSLQDFTDETFLRTGNPRFSGWVISSPSNYVKKDFNITSSVALYSRTDQVTVSLDVLGT